LRFWLWRWHSCSPAAPLRPIDWRCRRISGEASVPGLADVRVWGDAQFSHAPLQAEPPNLKAKYQERQGWPQGAEPPVSNLLALSGGR
jgi:hypothetical protein